MRLSSAALMLVLLAAVGCGGGNGSFAQDYNHAVRPLSELSRHIGTKPSSFDRLARRTAETRANLAKLDPPDGAGDELATMLSRLDEVVTDLRAVARTARGGDVVKQRRAARALVRSSSEVERAESRLKRAVGG
jgi:hypothetical protein